MESEYEVQQEQAGIRSDAELQKVLRQEDLTEAEVQAGIRAELLQERLLEEAVESRRGEASPELEVFQEEFFDKWRERTLCTPEAQSETCSGFEEDDLDDEPDAPDETESPGLVP